MLKLYLNNKKTKKARKMKGTWRGGWNLMSFRKGNLPFP